MVVANIPIVPSRRAPLGATGPEGRLFIGRSRLEHGSAVEVLRSGVDTAVIALWHGHDWPGTTSRVMSM